MLTYAGACSSTAEETQWLLRATASPVSLQAAADAISEPKLRTCMHAHRSHSHIKQLTKPVRQAPPYHYSHKRVHEECSSDRVRARLWHRTWWGQGWLQQTQLAQAVQQSPAATSGTYSLLPCSASKVHQSKIAEDTGSAHADNVGDSMHLSLELQHRTARLCHSPHLVNTGSHHHTRHLVDTYIKHNIVMPQAGVRADSEGQVQR
jgi:hypothetical protein